jgi:hypothetical protein
MHLTYSEICGWVRRNAFEFLIPVQELSNTDVVFAKPFSCSPAQYREQESRLRHADVSRYSEITHLLPVRE